MYPEWPKSPTDLMPLPLCDGPKLAAFHFKGPQQIDFLEVLGSGAHSVVLKVRIHGSDYALKLFKTLMPGYWEGPSQELWDNREAMTIMYNYQEPFSAECRAYGRLSESGYTELAIRCFGYVLLDEKHEETLQRQFADVFDDDYRNPVVGDVHFHCSQFLTEDGRQPPLRGILKEIGEPQERLETNTVKRMRQDIGRLQQLGIMGLDTNKAQMISGKFADFSTAITMPNFLTNPELNPHLTPTEQLAIGFNAFAFSLGDYHGLDVMVYNYNADLEEEQKTTKPKGKLGPTAYTFPEGGGLNKMRILPNRASVFTFVDPRLYVDLRKKAASHAKLVRWPLDLKPARWNYEEADNIDQDVLNGGELPVSTVAWTYKDGYLFPKKSPSYGSLNPFTNELPPG